MTITVGVVVTGHSFRRVARWEAWAIGALFVLGGIAFASLVAGSLPSGLGVRTVVAVAAWLCLVLAVVRYRTTWNRVPVPAVSPVPRSDRDVATDAVVDWSGTVALGRGAVWVVAGACLLVLSAGAAVRVEGNWLTPQGVAMFVERSDGPTVVVLNRNRVAHAYRLVITTDMAESTRQIAVPGAGRYVLKVAAHPGRTTRLSLFDSTGSPDIPVRTLTLRPTS
jgi:hypothetical protein